MPSRFRLRWRRYRRNNQIERYYQRLRRRRRNPQLDHAHLRTPTNVAFNCNDSDIFDCAERQVASFLQRRPEVHDLDRRISQVHETFRRSRLSRDGLISILTQAPRASLAQAQMDTSHHGYANKHERLYELIDFNDTIVDTILTMDDSSRAQFDERTKRSVDRICKRVGAPGFDETQWRAIIRGLTREVAVYLAAKSHGFVVYMTDRTRDALGIDVQVKDPESDRYINIDVKTPSSFRYRLDELAREGRLSERERIVGDERGFIIEHTGRGVLKTQVIVLCILPDKFGDLADWQFVDSEPMRATLSKLIREFGLNDDKFGAIDA